MALFLSSYTNKVDKKGRVSVPSAFRAVLSGHDFHGIIAYPSFVNPCVEASGLAHMERLSAAIDEMDPYAPERDAFAISILGACEQLAFDPEGRVILPPTLLEQGQISDRAVFVGKGATFEIWNPQHYADYAAKAREMALKERASLKLARSPHGGAT